MLFTDIAMAINVTAYAGGSVYVKCNTSGWDKKQKFSVFNMTRNQMSSNDRFFLQDNEKGYFEVGLVQLTTQDTGHYECPVGMTGGAPTPINLEVKKGKKLFFLLNTV